MLLPMSDETANSACASKAPSGDAVDMPALLEGLYASLLDVAPWRSFLDRLAASAQADFVTLILTPRRADRPGLLLTPGADPVVVENYIRELFAGDPFTGLPEGRVMHFRDFVRADQRRRNAAYFEFLRQTSSDEVIGVEISEDEALQLRLRYTRRAGARPFDAADMARMEALVPHLRIALRLFDRLATGETEQRIYAGAVERMAVGVVMLDQAGEVIRLNPLASAILAEADGVALRGSRLMLADPATARQLQAALAREPGAPPQTLRIARPSGAGDLCLVIGEADAPEHVSARGGPARVLFLSDPGQTPRISIESIRELLGLTHAEAAIAADVAGGLALADSAARLGISPNTARAHLRAIFSKTGVKRQSQLMHLVHQSLPGLDRTAR